MNDSIKYKDTIYISRLHLMMHFYVNEINKFPIWLFLHSKIYYVRRGLEMKFGREFSLEEVKELLKEVHDSSTSKQKTNERPVVL